MTFLLPGLNPWAIDLIRPEQKWCCQYKKETQSKELPSIGTGATVEEDGVNLIKI